MNPPSPVLQALAWRLVDRDLVALEQYPGDALSAEDAWVRRRLGQGRHGLPFELAAEAVTLSRSLAADPIAGMTELARATLRIEHGLPRVHDEDAWDTICRVVDPDLVALAHPAILAHPSGELATERHLAWPPALRAHHTLFHAVCHAELAEVHAHLGGSIHIAVLWGLLVSGALPPEALHTPTLEPVPDSSPWIGALTEAQRLLVRLAGAADGTPVGEALTPLVSFDGPVDTALWPLDASLIRKTKVLALLLPERAVLHCALVERRPELASTLLRYVKIRCAFNVLLSQRPGHRGLNEFRTWYDRRSAMWARPVRGSGARAHRGRVASALGMELLLEGWLLDHNTHGPPGGLPLDLELRTSLPVRGSETMALFQDLARGGRAVLERWGYPPLGLGIVHHVIKSKGRSDGAGIEAELEAVWSLLEFAPDLRPLLVGIDAASDELACPPRAFAAGFANIRAHLDADALRDDGPPIRLGFTFHAGEDFRDLLTGLRHVDEATCLLSMRPGDRLGHALALSWPVREFYPERTAAFPTVADHALDLCWASALLYRHGGYPAEERDARERLVAFLTECGGRPKLPVPTLIGALDLDGAHAPSSPRAQTLGDALKHTPERARPLRETEILDLLGIPLDTRDDLAPRPPLPRTWRALVEACQEVTRSRVMNSGLFIEINPSSNRIVGGFDTPDRLPYTRLSRPGPATDRPNLPLCIGTDDAGIFHTSLRREYELVGRGALAQGFAPPDVHAWLDELRRNGRRASFIRSHAPRGAALAEWLGRLLPEVAPTATRSSYRRPPVGRRTR